ncbi:MAG: DNA-directed RNA polymerase subunit beta', partial [Clostridia bacterium]|nr:DNA-directed RNA polymerase subunit beta' [Clostridia bacterium]
MEHNEFSSIKIGLASPEMIREWSYGEVNKPETINYRTLKAEIGGLFCERIFGPTKDGACMCGKYKNSHSKEIIRCEKCGVDVTTKKVRRERMGHIELAAPVSHIWYFKAIPSRMALVLDISPKQLEQVLYFAENVVLDPGSTPLEKGMVLSEKAYLDNREMYGNDFRVGMGAEAVKELLQGVDVEALSAQLKQELLTASGQKKTRIIKRLEVVEAFRKSGNKLEWMVLDAVPVIPPDIRPMVQLDGGRFASSDLNELYRRVISRNNRLKKLMEIRTPEIVIRNEKRMLQEAVDALIDNGRRGKPVTGPSNRALKSLSEMLRGKQGRFRQNLLGKRVDYSGRSVIVVGPTLKIYQCGLPREMALELFKPFVVKRLVEMGKATNVKDAQKKIERIFPEVWDALENVIKEHPVLLNRAPTLHRLSIQAFEPVLVEGRAIKLHPLVCTAFNADFDGDQMPVHVPLSAEAQAEARFLMLSANNLLKPMDGKAVTIPTQDMILGSYYLTMEKPGEPGEGSVYRDMNEAMMAYANGQLGLHAKIKVRINKEINGQMRTAIIDATLGRLIFNQPIPQDLGFIDRSVPGNEFKLEIDQVVKKKQLGQIIDNCIRVHTPAICAEMLDNIKAMGYKYSTRASFSISVYDMTIPAEKKGMLESAQKDVDVLTKHYLRGELSNEERYNGVIKIWNKTTDDVTKALQNSFSTYNPIKIMADSGARGSMTQMRQLAGMRGLMFATNGKTVELPIKSNFREGLNIMEYFMGARSSRKSLSDTALRTADSGYLTRRLVDVSQEMIIREDKCDTTKGAWVS